MTYEQIFEKSKKLIMKSDVSKIDGHLAVQVDITGEGEGAFYIELKDHELHVEPYEYYDNDCKFIMTGDNFLKMADGKLDPVAAFFDGRLKIDGSVDKALEFKNIVDSVKKQAKAEKKAAAKAPAKKAPAKKAPAKKTAEK
ncbi:MAG: SCP2 sterol-binding domain-containing protein [Oscillospiraceae bacterium]|nr:SCP2 sterol-binding domain-containing protein [Oscillospiraceae bacterium]